MSLQYDVFVCHASEDKESFVRPLVIALEKTGLQVWYDEHTMTLGDSLRRSIDRGLAEARFGVVILSKAFFAKNWTQHELDGLTARELGESRKVILPVWHGVGEADVRAYSSPLAGKLGVPSSKGVDHVVREITEAIGQSRAQTQAGPPKPTVAVGNAKITDSGNMVFLAGAFHEAANLSEDADGTVAVVIAPDGSEDDARFRELRKAAGHRGEQIAFAYGNEGGHYSVESVTSDGSGENRAWTVRLRPLDDRGDFMRDQMSYTGSDGRTVTADDIAELRARRILLNEQTADLESTSSMVFEVVVRGLGNAGSTERSLLPDVYGELKDCDLHVRLQALRLAAVLQLRLSRTVEHVLHLAVGPINGQKMPVDFRGKRYKVYGNVEPTIIAVSGSCDLDKGD